MPTPLPAAADAAVRQLTAVLDGEGASAVGIACERDALGLPFLAAGLADDGGGGDGGAGGAPVDRTRDAFFSDLAGAAAIEDDEGRRVASRAGPDVAALNIGVGRGCRASWEMRLEADERGEECTCFGFTTKPVVAAAYDGDNNMWCVCVFPTRAFAQSTWVKSSGSSTALPM